MDSRRRGRIDERGHDVTELTFRATDTGDWPQVATLLEEADLPSDGAQDHLGDFLVAQRADELVACAAPGSRRRA